jgi:hypothetical protein
VNTRVRSAWNASLGARRRGPIDPLLDRSDGVEILVQLGTVAGAQPAFEARDLGRQRIEDAGLPPHLFHAPGRAAAVAE